MSSDSHTPTADAQPGLWLARATVLSVSELLEQLGEMPSTPEEIGAEARERAAELVARLPRPEHSWEPGARTGRDSVSIEQPVAVRAAALLDLLSEMPSTPPGLLEDAEVYAALLWSMVPDEVA